VGAVAEWVITLRIRNAAAQLAAADQAGTLATQTAEVRRLRDDNVRLRGANIALTDANVRLRDANPPLERQRDTQTAEEVRGLRTERAALLAEGAGLRRQIEQLQIQLDGII
jgi:hypothetical protein